MSKWIKCSDQLPPVGVGVLVTNGEDATCAERMSSVDKLRWDVHQIYSRDAEVAFENAITHWMHLPSMPEKIK